MSSFQKYPKIRQLGHKENQDIFEDPNDEIIIEEKIDGGGWRFMFTDDDRIIYGSRNVSIGDNTSEIGGNWKRCVDYLNEKLKDKKNPLNQSAVFFGEACIRHTVSYDFENMPPFLGFDIIIFKDGNPYYLGYDEKVKAFTELDIPIVPLINRIKAKDFKGVEDKDIPITKYGVVQAEGWVFKNYSTNIMGKYVTTQHREEHRKTFGGSKKWANDDNERLVASYCTNPRIDKCIFKLINEDNMNLDLVLMTKLPTLVWQDIIEEHASDILMENWTLNLRGVRRQIGKRCLSVLKQVMVNNALNGK